jgi:hypothetical protein
MAAPRTELFTIRMSPDEMTMLRALADRSGLSGADVIRLALRRDYAAQFGEISQATPARRAPKGKK